MPAAGFARFAEQPDFGTLTWPDREPMVALNTMLAADGAALHVPAGFDGGLVQLVSIAGGDADFHPRHSIRLAKGARLTLLEISAGQGAYLLNTVAEIHVAEGAHLTHIRLQDEAADRVPCLHDLCRRGGRRHLRQLHAEPGRAPVAHRSPRAAQRRRRRSRI